MIFTIFKKELKDTLRDRRTFMTMIVIPVLIFPIILNLFIGISESFAKESATKKVKIGIVSLNDNSIKAELTQIPSILGEKEVIEFKDTIQMMDAIRNDSLQIGIFVNENFAFHLKEKSTAPITVYHNATEMGMKERAEQYMTIIQNNARRQRCAELNVNEQQLTPIFTSYINVASDKEMIGKMAGGILPYIFIAFGFIGCMYPAIDLFTGEKERGTIETLLTTPVKRWQILFGKMGVVVLSGLLAATCALFGLFLSIEVFQLVKDEELLAIIHSILNPSFIFALFVLLMPLTVFFAGVMIPITIYAKTFKEAQSIITPLNIVMVLPAMVGFFPGIKLDVFTACIPVINVVLATKELIAGTLNMNYLIISFIVMILLAISAVIFSFKQFDKETNVIQ